MKNGGLPPAVQNGVLPAADSVAPPGLLPPATKLPGIKEPFLLVFQFIWICLIIVPSILYSLVRKVIPPAGKSLKDKVVIVTGAGRGLGRGLAMKFAQGGARVAVVDVYSPLALETAKEITEGGGIAKAYTANVGKIEDIRRLRSEVTSDLGPVDVLVNNAGLMYGNSLMDMPEADLRAVVEVNLLSHFWMTKEFLPSMKERNSGHIVAISSASALMGLSNASAYSCCKSAVKGFMESLRHELNLNPENDIKTTLVLPYFINTSAHYLDHTDLRLPAVSVEDTVNAIVDAVRRDEVVLTVPGNMLYSLHLVPLFPQNVVDLFRKVFYCRVILPSKEERSTEPSQHIIAKLSSK